MGERFSPKVGKESEPTFLNNNKSGGAAVIPFAIVMYWN